MTTFESESTRQCRVAEDLIESDCRYFEYAAVNEQLPGATLSYMSGLAQTAAGCVVHRVQQQELVDCDLNGWLTQVEERFAAVGGRHTRIYLTTVWPALEAILKGAGYDARGEIGLLLRDPERLSEAADVTLYPITTDADWRAKAAVHKSGDVGPDGHTTPPDCWVEMEQRKSSDSSLKFFLVKSGDEVCGSVGVDEIGSILRLKNIVIHSDWRRRGIGSGVVRRLGEIAQARGKVGMGVFGVPGRPGGALYQRLRLEPIVTQYEWMRRS